MPLTSTGGPGEPLGALQGAQGRFRGPRGTSGGPETLQEAKGRSKRLWGISRDLGRTNERPKGLYEHLMALMGY